MTAVVMLVGISVGSWRFTLGALCCLVTQLAADWHLPQKVEAAPSSIGV